MTPVCRIAAIQGRQCLGHVSDSSDAPTAHSPPMPSAATNRKMSRCHHVCANAENPVKNAYVRIVRLSARLLPRRSPISPKNPPPSAQPSRKAAWMSELYHPTRSSRVSSMSSNCATNGSATSVYRCMSSPSNSQPSQAAMPDFHCWGERSRRLRTSSSAGLSPAGDLTSIGADIVDIIPSAPVAGHGRIITCAGLMA